MFPVDSSHLANKIYAIIVEGFENITSCVRDHNASKICVRDRIIKLTPFHGSVIYQIP